ncbi:MAG: efflux RND transporter periplasmic adaptor subunit [Betaproteobacteria bacterium]
MSMRTSHAWLGVAVLVLALSAIAACSDKDKDKAGAKPGTAAAIPVTTAPVVRKSMPLKLLAIGNVEPIRSVEVKSRIDGLIVAAHLADGDDVTKGQLLFELDARALQAQVQQMRATLQRDSALVANNEAKGKRYGELLQQGFISPDAFNQIKTDLDAARATAAADEAALDAARVQLSYTRITAPIAGRAGKVMIPVGNVVKANDTTPIVTINAIMPIYVSFAVPEQFLPAIRAFLAKGALPVSAIPAGDSHGPSEGTLTFIDNAVDAQTGTIRLRATFANRDNMLWPGQFANVTVTLDQQQDAIVIPAEALQNGPKGPYVYVVKPDSTAEMRSVKVDRTDGPDTVIVSGLRDGETVVVSGQIRLVPGAKVQSKNG